MFNISCDSVHWEFIVLVDSLLTSSIDPIKSRFASSNFRTMGIVSSRDSEMVASSSVLRKKMSGSPSSSMDSRGNQGWDPWTWSCSHRQHLCDDARLAFLGHRGLGSYRYHREHQSVPSWRQYPQVETSSRGWSWSLSHAMILKFDAKRQTPNAKLTGDHMVIYIPNWYFTMIKSAKHALKIIYFPSLSSFI